MMVKLKFEIGQTYEVLLIVYRSWNVVTPPKESQELGYIQQTYTQIEVNLYLLLFNIILEVIDIMSQRIKQLQEDIAQLQRLLLQSERPNVQNHLAQHISKLKTELENLKSVKIIQQPVKQSPPPQTTAQEIDRTNYVPLTKYAWDQQGNKVKLIFSLQGVGVECTKQQVQVIFTNWSVEMRIKGYKKLNHIFAIKKLCGQILPNDCKYVLKNNSITITLVKKENKSWAQIQFKEEKFSGKSEKEEEKDPGANIMGMMKKMYEEGDQNMKRTIAEAWAKANDKKGEKPDFSDRYDFLKK